MANELARKLLTAWAESANLRAFSHVVRQGETNQTEDAYRETYGGGLADDLSDHYYRHRPHPLGPGGLPTSAFGAYQAELGTWDDFQRACGERDMSPPNQDLFFCWCVNRRGALPAILAGQLETAIALCRKEWTSLPGGSEQNHKYEQLTQVYIKYGGTLEEPSKVLQEQPVAASTPSPELPTPSEEKTMLGGFLTNLLLSIIGGFTNQSTTQAVTSIVNKDPGSTAAQQLLSMLLSSVAAAAGTTPAAMQANDKTAIAATAAVQADPTKLKSVEDAAAAHLVAVAPFITQLVKIDQMLFDAENKGRQTVSTIAIEEHKAGLWDMTRTLVTFAAIMCSIIVIGIVGAIIYESIWQAKGIDVGLIGLGGPLLMAAIQCWKDVFAYRFDGTKSSQAAAEAQNAIRKYDDETKGQS